MYGIVSHGGAVGHGIRGGANGRLYWPVGSGSYRRGARWQDP
jgi:hypothetical protein